MKSCNIGTSLSHKQIQARQRIVVRDPEGIFVDLHKKRAKCLMCSTHFCGDTREDVIMGDHNTARGNNWFFLF